MKNLNLFLIYFLTFSWLFATASGQENLIAKNAKIEQADSGYSFTEGPAVAPDGKVYFTDQPNDEEERS